MSNSSSSSGVCIVGQRVVSEGKGAERKRSEAVDYAELNNLTQGLFGIVVRCKLVKRTFKSLFAKVSGDNFMQVIAPGDPDVREILCVLEEVIVSLRRICHSFRVDENDVRRLSWSPVELYSLFQQFGQLDVVLCETEMYMDGFTTLSQLLWGNISASRSGHWIFAEDPSAYSRENNSGLYRKLKKLERCSLEVCHRVRVLLFTCENGELPCDDEDGELPCDDEDGDAAPGGAPAPAAAPDAAAPDAAAAPDGETEDEGCPPVSRDAPTGERLSKKRKRSQSF